MPFNLLLLPLIGGFYFITHCNATAYHAKRQSGQRLVFYSALAGLFLLLVARLIVVAIGLDDRTPDGHREAIFVGSWFGILSAFLLVGLLRIRGWRFVGALDAELPSNRRGITSAASAFALASLLAGFSSVSAISVLVAGLVAVSLATISRKTAQVSAHPSKKILLRLTAFAALGIGALQVSAQEAELISTHWQVLVPFPYSGTSALALLLAFVAVPIINSVYPVQSATSREIFSDDCNSLELFFARAMNLDRMVVVTLDDSKAYAGWIVSLPYDLDDNGAVLRLLPLVSGFRDRETRELHLPVDYVRAFDYYENKVEQGELSWDEVQDMLAKAMPAKTIHSASFFDPQLFDHFNCQPESLGNEAPEET